MGRRARLWCGLVFVALVSCEALSAIGLAALSKLRGLKYDPISEDSLPERPRTAITALVRGETRYLAHSPTLGWTIRPGGAAGLYRANGQGLRADRDYASRPAPGVVRIAAFGDSYTHSDDVPNEETWERRLEEMRPAREVLNFGVPGFAPDQAFIRYREDGVRFAPHVVIVGVMPENLYRIVNVFRPFYGTRSELALSKPRFVLRGDALVLRPNPLPALADYERLLRDPASVLPLLGEEDYFFRTKARWSVLDLSSSVCLVKLLHQEMTVAPEDRVFEGGVYNTESEAFRLACRILDEFHASVVRNGSHLLVVMTPERSDVVRERRGGGRRYEPLLRYLRERGYAWLDLMDAFSGPQAPTDVDAIARGHYTALGNRLAARAIDDWLQRHAVDSPPSP